MMWGWCSTPSAGRWSVCRNCTRRSLTHSWSEHTGRWMLNWWRHGGAHWTFPAMPWGLSLKQTKDIFRHFMYIQVSGFPFYSNAWDKDCCYGIEVLRKPECSISKGIKKQDTSLGFNRPVFHCVCEFESQYSPVARVRNWAPTPSTAHSKLLKGGNLNTSVWMIFQPLSPWSRSSQPPSSSTLYLKVKAKYFYDWENQNESKKSLCYIYRSCR